MKHLLTLIILLLYLNVEAQTVVTTTPQYPTETDSIIVYFDATKGDAGLKGFTGDVYAHTGVITNLSTSNSDWRYVMAPWATNYSDIKLVRDSTDHYHLVIGNPRTYYSGNHENHGAIPDNEHILKLAFVFRDATGSRTGRDVGGKDIFAPIFASGISIILNSPTVNSDFGDPARSPYFAQSGSTFNISATTTEEATITLFINGVQKTQTISTSIAYPYVVNSYPIGLTNVQIIAVDAASRKDTVQFSIMRNPAVKIANPPAGTQIGINYGSDPTKVTLAFYAPKKNFVYAVGEFGSSDWKVDTAYFMNRYEPKTDSVIWWKTISNLESGKEYAYQFLVDGNLRIYDPYTEKILDGDNDKYIPAAVYPNLKAYPAGKTSGLVSVLQTGQPAYQWQVAQFTRPAREKLVIYELLVRDFVSTHWYQTIKDTLSYLKKLGVNAIELMPITEFEGNDSWGYNPTTYFAPDKYYGTKNDLKALIDECHKNGIAVIQDIVLNHAYNSNSMAQLYWDSVNNRPAADNPWFNVTSPNTSYSWGNDFNHASKDTKYFVDRVTSFWLTEYKMDGFRFDFSKGFTNTPGDGTAYDASRIAILERIARKIWDVSPGAYVILEHFTANSEEMELSINGLMLWGNLNSSYSNAAKGYVSNSNINDISYKQRGWTLPNLVGYMESHDEERLMYNNLNSGYSSGTYNIRDLSTALDRIKLAANLFILVPGPKMIWQFGEIGYDYSIDYGGRLADKPVRWDYYLYSGERRKVYNTFASLIKLKKDYPAFSSSNFTLNGSFPVKSLYITDATMNAAAMGNFDVVPQTFTANFPSQGTWYEFFTGETLTVGSTNPTLTFQPGEFRLYTTQYIPRTDVVTGVEDLNELTKSYSLSQNYPNPFNPSTVIKYQLAQAGQVVLKVYDLLGREVASLVNEYQEAGAHSAAFSGAGRQLSSGIYFYRLQAGRFTAVKKMILIK